jgi:hypothetical protein
VGSAWLSSPLHAVRASVNTNITIDVKSNVLGFNVLSSAFFIVDILIPGVTSKTGKSGTAEGADSPETQPWIFTTKAPHRQSCPTFMLFYGIR